MDNNFDLSGRYYAEIRGFVLYKKHPQTEALLNKNIKEIP